MSIRILLADDHQIMRDGLRAILASEESFEIVGEAENGREAAALARTLVPDVVIMDIGMPDLNGVEATRQIKADNPGIKVIALSMYADRGYVLGILEAGASGYVLKTGAYDEAAPCRQGREPRERLPEPGHHPDGGRCSGSRPIAAWYLRADGAGAQGT